MALALALSVSCDGPDRRLELSPTEDKGVLSATADKNAEKLSPLPDNSLAYRPLLLKWTISYFGDESYVSVFAAQIHQESAWCKYNISHAGAKGCSQFMDRTAQWAIDDPNGLPCATLGDFLDPTCALPALTWLNRFNYVRSPQKDRCDTLAFMLAKYNGGGVKGDQQAAEQAGFDPELWFHNTELFNGRRRTAANFKENRDYPRKILGRLSEQYHRAGYGGVLLCKNVDF